MYRHPEWPRRWSPRGGWRPRSEPAPREGIAAAHIGVLFCERRKVGKVLFECILIFWTGLVPFNRSGEPGDQAGVIRDQAEGVGEVQEVPGNACASGVFGGNLLGQPLRGWVYKVPVKLKHGVKGVVLQVVEYVLLGVGDERPWSIGIDCGV